MSKIMAVVLVILLSGCATENPHYKNAQTIGGTVVGAVIGYKTLGGGILGGLAGAAVGHEVAKGAQWKPGDDEIVYIDPPGYYPQSGYSSCGAVAVYCDTTPKQGMYPPRPGMCNDPDSGGEASYEDLQRRAERRAGCYSSNQIGYNQPQHASYGPQPAVIVSYPPNMWERADRKQKTTEVKKQSRLNVGNYTGNGAVPKDCQTGNWEMDSGCLSDWSDTLAKLQVRCVKEKLVSNPDCLKNPGVLAGEYLVLSEDLKQLQEKRQGFSIGVAPK